MNWLTRVSDLIAGRKSSTVRAHFFDDPHAALADSVESLTRALFGGGLGGGVVRGTCTMSGLVVQVRDVLAVSSNGRHILTIPSADLDEAGIPTAPPRRQVYAVAVPVPEYVERTYQAGRETVTDRMAVRLGRVVLVFSDNDQTAPVVPDGGVILAEYRRTAAGLEVVPRVTPAPVLRLAPERETTLTALGFGATNKPFTPSNPAALSAARVATVRALPARPEGSDVLGVGPGTVIKFRITGGDVRQMTIRYALADPNPVPWSIKQNGVVIAQGQVTPTGSLDTFSWADLFVPGGLLGDFQLHLTPPSVWSMHARAIEKEAGYISAPNAGDLSVEQLELTATRQIFALFSAVDDKPRGVVGRLTPDALPRSTAPLSLADGEAYILAVPGATPEIRTKENGVEYRAQMVQV